MIRGFDHPGDYANLNSYQLRDGTAAETLLFSPAGRVTLTALK